MPTYPILLSFFFIFNLFHLCVLSEFDSTTLIRLPNDDDDLCPISKPLSCPVTCFKTDPVCGVDGVTYWCGCADAHCSGVRVSKLGFCPVGNGNGPVSGQALLILHIVWLIVVGFSVLFGLF